jgi:osmotically inducible protein OsmC
MNRLTTDDDSKMPTLESAVYTAQVHTTGGRDGGSSRSSDGRLDVKLAVPGSHREGTNPEQLFAAGWSACFTSAMLISALRRKIALEPGTAVDAEVDLCKVADGTHVLQARLNVSLPGLKREVAEEIVHAAHQICPYSKVTRGNINLVINLV